MYLQEIRARQAMDELGIKGDVEVIHSADPKTFINGVEYSLVFPRMIGKYWSPVKKQWHACFIGHMTPQRREWLNRFENVLIYESDKGRTEKERDFDLFYFKTIARSKYALCPSGDFVWTYRFFEACLNYAFPIIEQEHPLYEGFRYGIGQYVDFTEDDILHNYKLAEQRHRL
jgi:hypothetical protein